MIAQILDGLVFKAQKSWIKKYLTENNLLTGKVLDLGSGYGFYSELFGENYIGIDNDLERIKSAKKTYGEKKFLEMSADQLNFPDNNFDLVVSFLVLHHLTDRQLGQALMEVRRVLMPNGKFLITDLVVPDKNYWLARPLMRLDNAERRTIGQLTDLFSEAGFKIEETQVQNSGIFTNCFLVLNRP